MKSRVISKREKQSGLHRCREELADRRGDAAGAYATDQEARLALANALEALYDANPALDFGDRDTGIARLIVRQELNGDEDSVRTKI